MEKALKQEKERREHAENLNRKQVQYVMDNREPEPWNELVLHICSLQNIENTSFSG